MSDEKMMPTDVERVAQALKEHLRQNWEYGPAPTDDDPDADESLSVKITSESIDAAAKAAIAALAHPPQARDEVQRLHDAVLAAQREALMASPDTSKWLADCEALGTAEAAFRQALAALPPVDPAGDVPTDAVERVASVMASEIRRITGYVLSATTARVVAEALPLRPPVDAGNSMEWNGKADASPELLVWRWLDYNNIDGVTRKQLGELVQRIRALLAAHPAAQGER